MTAVHVEVGTLAAAGQAHPGRVQRVVLADDLDPPVRGVADDLARAGRDDGRAEHRASLRRRSVAERIPA